MFSIKHFSMTPGRHVRVPNAGLVRGCWNVPDRSDVLRERRHWLGDRAGALEQDAGRDDRLQAQLLVESVLEVHHSVHHFCECENCNCEKKLKNSSCENCVR